MQRHNQIAEHLLPCYVWELSEQLANHRINPIWNFHNNVYQSSHFPFRFESPICSSTLSITDVTYGSSNNNEIISNYDEHNYDDEEDESPKKGLLKQMFCLPLN